MHICPCFLLLFLHCLISRCALLAQSCFSFTQIALKRFNSEEVGAWSALRSPRVVELFGVVREGPNVLLFMDLKSGTQASTLPLTQVTFFQYVLMRLGTFFGETHDEDYVDCRNTNMI